MPSSKRQLRFRSAADVAAEIVRLRRNSYRKTKNWNLSQICEHLTKTMQGEMDGLGFRIPWLLRKTVGNWLTLWVLKTQAMPSVPTLPSLKPVSTTEVEDELLISNCLETLQRAEGFDVSLEDYPFVDGLSHDQWRQLMWIHAAHHLGFLQPNPNSPEQS